MSASVSAAKRMEYVSTIETTQPEQNDSGERGAAPLIVLTADVEMADRAARRRTGRGQYQAISGGTLGDDGPAWGRYQAERLALFWFLSPASISRRARWRPSTSSSTVASGIQPESAIAEFAGLPTGTAME